MIRRATIDDLEDVEWRRDVEQLAYDFFNEAKLPGTFKPALFFASWRSYLLNGVGVLLYADCEKAVSGVIGGILSPSAITGDILLSEAFWFVDNAARGKIIGARLLLEFINIAKELHVDHVTMAHLVTGDVSAVYTKLGFKLLETHYILTL